MMHLSYRRILHCKHIYAMCDDIAICDWKRDDAVNRLEICLWRKASTYYNMVVICGNFILLSVMSFYTCYLIFC